MVILELDKRPEMLREATEYFWKQWGSETNLPFYHDCMKHSLDPDNALPKFYVMLDDNRIVGTYALLRNDLISRQDLYPWFACLFVEPDYRGNKIGFQLLEHAKKQANAKGFKKLYLATDLEAYYEKYGWSYLEDGFGITGEPIKIYNSNTE